MLDFDYLTRIVGQTTTTTILPSIVQLKSSTSGDSPSWPISIYDI